MWIITLDGQRPPAQVAADLTRAGLAVASVLDQIGVITAAGSPELASQARALPGVADVAPDTAVGMSQQPGT